MGAKKSHRKRSASEHEEDGDGESSMAPNIGLGATLASLERDGEDASVGDWTLVQGPSKKRRKKKNKGQQSAGKEDTNASGGESTAPVGDRKPALRFAETHKQQRMLKISDFQDLMLYCLADGPGPQWVSVAHHGQVQKVVVLMVPGLEKGMFTGQIPLSELGDAVVADASMHNEPTNTGSEDSKPKRKMSSGFNRHDIENGPDDYLPIALDASTLPVVLSPLADVFDKVWPIKTPGDDKTCRMFSPLSAMLMSAIPKSYEEKQMNKQKGVKPVSQQKTSGDQRTPVTQFIATPEELFENDYIMHPASFESEKDKCGNNEKRKVGKFAFEDGWKDTAIEHLDEGIVPDSQIQKGSITASRTILAMDCEMCLAENEEFVLTRISVVGWDGEVVLDSYVKPDIPIKDYLTMYSGITPEILASVTTTLSDIQGQLLELFHAKAILIGHSLDSDLRALKMTHPFIVDTSMIFPHPRGPPLKSSLKWLSQKYLSREIQKGHGSKGHDSVEDARATLDLVKQKCERGPKWGSSESNTESIFKRLSRVRRKGAIQPSLALLPEDQRLGKTGAIVDNGSVDKSFGPMATYCLNCTSDANVITSIKQAVYGDPQGAVIPGGGVDYTWARFRELEALRGWQNDFRNPVNSSAQLNTEPKPSEVATCVKRLVGYIKEIKESLPPCTLFMVYSGTGDPREMARLQQMQKQFKKEYATKKWDELSVRWTDVEAQALKAATAKARKGVGFLCMT